MPSQSLFSIVAFTFSVHSQTEVYELLVDFYQREIQPQNNIKEPDKTGWLPPLDQEDLQGTEQFEASGLFQPYIAYPSGAWDSAVGIGDFNHDGLNDVAITDSSGNNKLRVFLQNANGTLDAPVVYNTGPRPESLAVGDLNNDQRDDVVVGNVTNNTIGVFLQQMEGTLAPQVTYPTSTPPDAVVIADLNNDGLNDVAVSHWNAPNIRVFLQQSDGTLGSPISYPAPQAGYDDMDTGDLNNDGLIDVIKMNGQGFNPNLSVYLQNACEVLDGPISYDLPGNILSNGVAAGDLTGDGLVDLALSHGGNRPNSKISVFTQTMSSTLQLDATYDAYDIPEPVEIADVNMDGLRDVIVAHGGWFRVGIFLQQPNGTLGPYLLDPIPYASHYQPQGMDVGDINNDDLPDIVMADYNNGLIVLYHVSDPGYPTPTPIPIFTPFPCTTPSPTPTVTATPTSSPTITPTPTATVTPTSSATVTLTPTASATPTSSATITVTPTEPSGCVPVQGPVLYWNDFEAGVGAEWSARSLDASPNGQNFLGQFNNNGTRLTISCLPAHETLRITVDLYIIRSWDGNETLSGDLPVGPDIWRFGASNQTILMTTFSNWSSGHQAYPLLYPHGNQPAFSGALEINLLGYEFLDRPMDAIYRLSFLIPHQADVLDLDFSALGLQAADDESWGLDNVEVRVIEFEERIFLPMIIH